MLLNSCLVLFLSYLIIFYLLLYLLSFLVYVSFLTLIDVYIQLLCTSLHLYTPVRIIIFDTEEFYSNLWIYFDFLLDRPILTTATRAGMGVSSRLERNSLFVGKKSVSNQSGINTLNKTESLCAFRTLYIKQSGVSEIF